MLNAYSQREDFRATLPNLLSILSVAEQTIQKSYRIQESASASFLPIDDGAAHDDELPMSTISETSIDMMMVSVPVSAASAAKVYSASEENISVPQPSRYTLLIHLECIIFGISIEVFHIFLSFVIFRHHIGSSRNRGSFSDDNLVKYHEMSKNMRKETNASTTVQRKSFSSEPILPTENI